MWDPVEYEECETMAESMKLAYCLWYGSTAGGFAGTGIAPGAACLFAFLGLIGIM